MRPALALLLACPLLGIPAADPPAVPSASAPSSPAPAPAAAVEPEDLLGIWQGQEAGISYTLIVDPRVDGAPLMSFFTNGHGYIHDTSEAGTTRFDGNHIIFHVMRDRQRIRTRDFTILHHDATDLTLAWDKPYPAIVHLHRIADTLPAR